MAEIYFECWLFAPNVCMREGIRALNTFRFIKSTRLSEFENIALTIFISSNPIRSVERALTSLGKKVQHAKNEQAETLIIIINIYFRKSFCRT